jgi:hypothetical protein
MTEIHLIQTDEWVQMIRIDIDAAMLVENREYTHYADFAPCNSIQHINIEAIIPVHIIYLSIPLFLYISTTGEGVNIPDVKEKTPLTVSAQYPPPPRFTLSTDFLACMKKCEKATVPSPLQQGC